MVLRQLGVLSVPGQSLREMRARGSLLLGPHAMGRACSGPASSSRQLRAAAWPWRPAPGTAALLGTSHLSAAQLRRLNLQFVCFPNPKNDFVIHLTSYNQALKIARQNLSLQLVFDQLRLTFYLFYHLPFSFSQLMLEGKAHTCLMSLLFFHNRTGIWRYLSHRRCSIITCLREGGCSEITC